MEEGVAVEGEGGAKPGVTEVGWPLPCSLSSLLNMNCRARAEGLARRLQTGLHVGSGGPVALENTLLVTPGPDDHYDSMECRHASLDDPDHDLLGDLNLRPIHVVTSEPSLRLCLPSLPTDPSIPEPDSDVYYDFDLVSPESNNEADETEAEAEVKRDERPESGCLTGLTSPVVSNYDLSDEDGAEGQRCPPADLRNTIMCSPDADLRVVRQILSFTTLAEVSVATEDDEGGQDVALENSESVTQQLDERSHDFRPSVSARVGQAQSPPPTTCEPPGTEGADSTTDVQHSRSLQVSSPVANGDSCWRQHEPDIAQALALSYSDQERDDVACSPGSDGDDTLCDDTFEGADNAMHKRDTAVIFGDGGTVGQESDTYRCDVGSPVFMTDVTVPYTTVWGDSVCSDVVEPEVDACEHKTGRETTAESGCVLRAISGTLPPIPSPHLYPPSEGQPTDMEMLGEVFEDSDTEEIETLAEDDEASDADENEEDVEEEAILTGKFRNFRGYTERVRRLSEDPEDYTDPESISYEETNLCASPKLKSSKEEDVEEDLSTQLPELEVEEVGIVEPEDEDEPLECYERSSSEEPDPARVEDFKLRIKRSSSLKSGKTPPGTPGRKKIVRFADMMGLDLAAVRTFLGGVPRVPRRAFWDLEVEREAKEVEAAMSMAAQVPTRVLTPLFQQPGAMPNFMARVREQRVVVENVEVGLDLSIRGFIRVLSLDFNKSVHVRYTFDHWRNFHEAQATYVADSYDGATDRFSFLLWGNFLQDNGALIFCVRYHTLGQEFWDNNLGRDYVLQCYTTLADAGDESAPRSLLPQNASSIGAVGYGDGGSAAGYGGGGISSSRPDNFSSSSFNNISPTMPNDPWVTRFF